MFVSVFARCVLSVSLFARCVLSVFARCVLSVYVCQVCFDQNDTYNSKLFFQMNLGPYLLRRRDEWEIVNLNWGF